MCVGSGTRIDPPAARTNSVRIVHSRPPEPNIRIRGSVGYLLMSISRDTKDCRCPRAVPDLYCSGSRPKPLRAMGFLMLVMVPGPLANARTVLHPSPAQRVAGARPHCLFAAMASATPGSPAPVTRYLPHQCPGARHLPIDRALGGWNVVNSRAGSHCQVGCRGGRPVGGCYR